MQAIILARGGSKSIPKKNIVNFCGKPLIGWTIEQCTKSELIENVWVSSDSKEIIEIAEEYGAKIIRRPHALSGDESTSESGWLHAMKTLNERQVKYDALFCPQVTSPLRKESDIDEAIAKFKTDKLDSLFSASKVDDLYFWYKNESGKLESVNYDYRNRKRRQDHEPQIIENGSFYIFKPEILEQQLNRLGGRIGYSEMEPWQIFEIDNSIDLRVCCALMNEFVLRGK
ncbi:MAG: hypothetical protein CBC25_04455 [Pelagibacteraceae bacterium TMED65]|nr:MAG: hypothetical protein CBC25_04455 [Pelagibacteraceae bacterium TMED65]|tara:strand:- start:584 stop:1270 length:687 start_codon:yes stop_codon:yes gene_type:complete